MGQREDLVPVDAFHILGGHQGINDGFLRGLEGGDEERIHLMIGEHLHLKRGSVRMGLWGGR